MIRSAGLERKVLEALRSADKPSTTELMRILAEKDVNDSRPKVRNALRALEDEGSIVNVGGEAAAWKAK